MDTYTKAMFGCHAIHVPMWMVAQDQGDAISFVGATRDNKLNYGSALAHQLILGEIIVRPHVVVESNYFTGAGLSGLLTQGNSMDDWVKHGNILVDPMGQFS